MTVLSPASQQLASLPFHKAVERTLAGLQSVLRAADAHQGGEPYKLDPQRAHEVWAGMRQNPQVQMMTSGEVATRYGSRKRSAAEVTKAHHERLLMGEGLDAMLKMSSEDPSERRQALGSIRNVVETVRSRGLYVGTPATGRRIKPATPRRKWAPQQKEPQTMKHSTTPLDQNYRHVLKETALRANSGTLTAEEADILLRTLNDLEEQGIPTWNASREEQGGLETGRALLESVVEGEAPDAESVALLTRVFLGKKLASSGMGRTAKPAERAHIFVTIGTAFVLEGDTTVWSIVRPGRESGEWVAKDKAGNTRTIDETEIRARGTEVDPKTLLLIPAYAEVPAKAPKRGRPRMAEGGTAKDRAEAAKERKSQKVLKAATTKAGKLAGSEVERGLLEVAGYVRSLGRGDKAARKAEVKFAKRADQKLSALLKKHGPTLTDSEGELAVQLMSALQEIMEGDLISPDGELLEGWSKRLGKVTAAKKAQLAAFPASPATGRRIHKPSLPTKWKAKAARELHPVADVYRTTAQRIVDDARRKAEGLKGPQKSKVLAAARLQLRHEAQVRLEALRAEGRKRRLELADHRAQLKLDREKYRDQRSKHLSHAEVEKRAIRELRGLLKVSLRHLTTKRGKK